MPTNSPHKIAVTAAFSFKWTHFYQCNGTNWSPQFWGSVWFIFHQRECVYRSRIHIIKKPPHLILLLSTAARSLPFHSLFLGAECCSRSIRVFCTMTWWATFHVRLPGCKKQWQMFLLRVFCIKRNRMGYRNNGGGGAAKQIGKNSICCIKPVFAVFWSIRFNNLLNKNKK